MICHHCCCEYTQGLVSLSSTRSQVPDGRYQLQYSYTATMRRTGMREQHMIH